MTCTFCGREIPVTVLPELGITSGKPYCPEKMIESCNSAFGRRAGHFIVKDWKATLVHGQ